MADEVNQVILGFAHTVSSINKVSLTPISKGAGRTVVVARVQSDGAIKFSEIAEPFHDSNKMYASIRGAPSDQAVERDLEDFGSEEKMVLTSAHEVQSDSDAPVLDRFMGAGWISSEHLPDENTRVCIGVHLPNKAEWIFVVGKASGLFGEDFNKWNTSNVLSYIAERGISSPLPAGAVLFPMVCPLRVVTPQGVVFVG